ncbi:MAG: glycosyltransferase family 9 protein [Lachnospiraceae bacterium]|nr:glycosyltransferase family 9 protein [Lachnospiraceae bacterium]
MAWHDTWEKTGRWMNIWMSQFRIAGLKNRRPSTCDPYGIVLIKIDAIGDFLIWLDSAPQYRKLYPGQRITLVCNTACAEIAGRTGFFDEVVPVQSRRLESDNKYKKEIWDSFRDKNFRTLLQTAYSRTIDMDLLAMNIPAEEKIAFEADESRLNLSRCMALESIRKKLDKVYDRLIPSGGENLMELERNAVFIRGLGQDFQAGYPSLPQMQVQQGVIPPKPYAVIFPGGSSGKKMWPIERFAKVGEYIVSEKGIDVCLCGGANEAYLYSQFVDAMEQSRDKGRVHDLFGKTTLPELAEVIRNASLFVGNDTSGIHFAAAVNTKGICIFGEFAYGRFLPYRCERDCRDHKPIIVCSAKMHCAGCVYGTIKADCKEHLFRTGRYQCIDGVSVEQVLREI